MEFLPFLDELKEYISYSPCLAPFREVHLIANPAAGGFRQRSVFHRTRAALAERLKVVRDSGEHIRAGIAVHVTRGSGHAFEIAGKIIAEHGEKGKILFLTTGGDGTGTEVVSAIYQNEKDHPTAAGGHVVFRMPFGTGNDGLDAATMEEVFDIFRSDECTTEKIGLLECSFADSRVIYAVNIASFGLDAYVTDNSNKLKAKIPGSFYTIMVDFAALFYEKSVPVRPLRVEYTGRDGKTRVYENRVLLVAAGVSGHRNYGKGKRVLPGDENICIIKPMKFLRKLKLKDLLYEGSHVGEPETDMLYSADFTLQYDDKLPFQYDGESLWLSADAFPVRCRVLPPSVTVLRPASGFTRHRPEQ